MVEPSQGILSEVTGNETDRDNMQSLELSTSLDYTEFSLTRAALTLSTETLSRSTVQDGLSQLGYTADGTKLVYLSLTLVAKGISDCTIISSYNHLQYIDLSHNQLKELSVLSCLPNLSSLIVSHNKLSKLLDFNPPHNLSKVDYSYNEIEEICDLSEFGSICTLILDGNQIRKLIGLTKLHCLTSLSISENRIERIEGLDNLPLKYLNLSSNSLTSINNLHTLHLLQVINLASNQISSLKGLNDHSYLNEINMEENEIIELNEIKHLKDLRALETLNLRKNPIQALSDYRQVVVIQLPSLITLDSQKLTIDEKVATQNRYCPPQDVTAGHDHLHLTSKSVRKSVRLHYSTLTKIDEPYPMLVLCGPQGSGKGFYSQSLVEEFPSFFGLGVSHTTRPQGSRESHGRDYYFINEMTFNRASDAGEFIEVCKIGNYMYGITMAAIEQVAQQGLACVTHMTLQGLLILKRCHFEPRYILTMPLTGQLHEQRMRSKSYITDREVQTALNDVQYYREFHQNNPGFFDATINTDDLQEGYNILRSIVMAYGGITPETPLTLSLSASRPTTQHTSTTISPIDTAQVQDHDALFPSVVKTSSSAPIQPVLAQPWSRPSSSSSFTPHFIKKSLSDQASRHCIAMS